MKLFLYSAAVMTDHQRTRLCRLVGKDPDALTIASIVNAVDVIDGSDAWIGSSTASLPAHHAHITPVDLRRWGTNRAGLYEHLAGHDVIWVSGGNTYYLRWMMHQTGVDTIIRDLVAQGVVYAGWSAGAIMAGPTLRFFEPVEDMGVVPQVFYDGLALTDAVPIPHMDLDEFTAGMTEAQRHLTQAGFTTVPLNEDQTLVIDGDQKTVL
ncbi:MAG TPA: Type 1 glutamine amidotransferase-like domain-containing protein [Herpetosiphonaceae bacterium]|nr:Type 1 glutamine amidotransferase-like domain-containing protein [Herpetosiphonaceae bacterium]